MQPVGRWRIEGSWKDLGQQYKQPIGSCAILCDFSWILLLHVVVHVAIHIVVHVVIRVVVRVVIRVVVDVLLLPFSST